MTETPEDIDLDLDVEETTDVSQGDADSAPAPVGLTMTQDELDALIVKRVDRSKRSTVNNLLSEVGYTDLDDLKGALDKLRSIEDADKTETEKLQGNLDTANAQVTELSAEVDALRTSIRESNMRNAVLTAAREADFLKESFNDVWLVVQSTADLLDGLKYDEDGGNVTGAKAVVAKVAKERPHWVSRPASGKIPGAKVSGTAKRPRTAADTEAFGDEKLVRF